ncbi:hypothetical protein CcarbDRAFT_3104 [Clostridium carboxidivorans P7]|uniref:Uncharacterized protein n=1 Tax=Clostridium carboxidivorans P7 TaxID=536227 RepID=C6PWD7_9CLOT|nr:hypothetical protein CcarbDRAFT_3104 [Clostridium carboxidivorans P7]
MAKINKKNSILWISTVNFGMHDCEVKLKWCEETL